jgi:nitroimidazol reductase NimA-like FMN-containing flavoprotein (pyridoxamine 5'-phosphate oxidase superfamily)
MEARRLDDDVPGVEWDAVTAGLDGLTQAPDTGGPNRYTTWLTTINGDGSPHVTAVGAVWIDGTFWFQTGDRTRKARNLGRDPRCAIAVSTHGFDLVIEGTAEKVRDPAPVSAAAARWAELGWPAEVAESGTAITAPFNAPGVGPPPWDVYRITARSATALGAEEPGGATRWSF